MRFLILLSLCFCCSSAVELDRNWWKYTTIYELMVQVFKDSDGDGFGDLQGLISKLDYFVDLGVDTLYITPFCKTEFRDNGYDIVDYMEIDPKFGTMEDFDQLMKEIKARGMKIILDLVINHSSKQHEWFQKSIKRIDPFTDYYVWKDPIFKIKSGTMDRPNKWRSIFGGPAWTYVEKRNQYYYHVFLNDQPDLNLRNEKVKNEIKDIIKFWLDKGIHGFRLDAAFLYIEDNLFQDDSFFRVAHTKETVAFTHELSEYVEQYNVENGGLERILIGEVNINSMVTAQYYGTKDYRVCHFPLNNAFNDVRQEITAVQLDNIISRWTVFFNEGKVPAWVTSNHDGDRIGSRIRSEYHDIFTVITAVLPGVIHVYYGTEIGMMNGFVHRAHYKDNSGRGTRDPSRLPMQWDDSISAGFSSNKITFSPINSDYQTLNVKIQKQQETSHYNLFKSLLELRKTETLKYGDFRSHVYSYFVYTFWRSYSGKPTVIVVVNLSKESKKVKLKKILKFFPRSISVVAASTNSGFKKGFTIGRREDFKLTMKPLSVVVFSTEPCKDHSRKEMKLGLAMPFKLNVTEVRK